MLLFKDPNPEEHIVNVQESHEQAPESKTELRLKKAQQKLQHINHDIANLVANQELFDVMKKTKEATGITPSGFYEQERQVEADAEQIEQLENEKAQQEKKLNSFERAIDIEKDITGLEEGYEKIMQTLDLQKSLDISSKINQVQDLLDQIGSDPAIDEDGSMSKRLENYLDDMREAEERVEKKNYREAA